MCFFFFFFVSSSISFLVTPQWEGRVVWRVWEMLTEPRCWWRWRWWDGEMVTLHFLLDALAQSCIIITRYPYQALPRGGECEKPLAGKISFEYAPHTPIWHMSRRKNHPKLMNILKYFMSLRLIACTHSICIAVELVGLGGRLHPECTRLWGTPYWSSTLASTFMSYLNTLREM